MGLFSKKEEKPLDFNYIKNHPIEHMKEMWQGEEVENTFKLANRIKTSNIADDIDLLFDIKHILSNYQKLVDDGLDEFSSLFKFDEIAWVIEREIRDIYHSAAVVANAVYVNIFGEQIANKLLNIGCFSTAYVLALWSIDDVIRENDPFRTIINNPKFMNSFFNGDKDNVIFYFLYNNGYAMHQDIINLDYINDEDSIIWNREVFKKRNSDKIVEYDIRLVNDKETRKKALYKEDGSIRELDTIEYYLNKEKPDLVIKDTRSEEQKTLEEERRHNEEMERELRRHNMEMEKASYVSMREEARRASELEEAERKAKSEASIAGSAQCRHCANINCSVFVRMHNTGNCAAYIPR